MSTVAVLGLGAMGLPMAVRLAGRLAGQRPVRGFDINESRRKLANDAGVDSFDSAREAAAGASVVLVAVRNDDQLTKVLFGPKGVAEILTPDSVVILTSTVGSDSVLTAVDGLAKYGIALVDALRAGAGDLLIVVGAEPTAPKAAASTSGLRLPQALRGLADSAAVPVCAQLDHASNLETIRTGVAAGADAVLVDGSAMDYEANIQLVRSARDAIGDPSIVLEAELGGLAGDEDRAFAMKAAGLTDPGQVADFVTRSGAQLLAVAVGNVHGKYAGAPKLRWDLLQNVAIRTNVPLVLHGASGLPAEDLAATPKMRVGKVNFNTELRTGVLSVLERKISSHRSDGENLLGLLGVWQATVRGFTEASRDTLSGHAAIR